MLYRQITHRAQQMANCDDLYLLFLSTMIPQNKSQIQHLLKQIQYTLKNFLLSKNQNSNIKAVALEKTAEQVKVARLTSQKILTQIINNKNAEKLLKTLLMEKLKETMSSAKIMKLYMAYSTQQKEAYSILNTNSYTLITEIVQNIKLIEEELINLADNIGTFEQDYADMNLMNNDQLEQIQIYYLLVVVMEESQIELPETVNELLFRMYILQESINLIFHKTNRVFQQLIDELYDEQNSERSSYQSDNSTKRSALSESIEIFKQRQLREQMERLEISREFPKSNVIKSNYEFSKPKQKEIKQKPSAIGCCFIF